MAYYVGDIPTQAILIDSARDGEPIDLAPFTAGSTIIQLRDFEGTLVVATFTATLDAVLDEVRILWPATSPFAAAGLYTLNVTLVGTGVRERLAPVYLVAQADTGWHTVDSARADRPQGLPSTDHRLYQLLELAKQQCLEYAPVLAALAPIPAHYREAQLMQATNLYNAGLVDPNNGEQGGEGFSLTPFPLDWQVKQVLRPKRVFGGTF